jgi:hypothetical protein
MQVCSLSLSLFTWIATARRCHRPTTERHPWTCEPNEHIRVLLWSTDSKLAPPVHSLTCSSSPPPLSITPPASSQCNTQGVLKVGYLIVSVDGVDVSNTLCALPPLILGQEGTPVAIGYIRAPGEETRIVNVPRGGGGGGGRSLSSMSMHQSSSSSMGVHGRGKNARVAHSSNTPEQLPSRPNTASGAYDDRHRLPFADEIVENFPAMRIDTGASSAMELRTYEAYGPDSPQDCMSLLQCSTFSSI